MDGNHKVRKYLKVYMLNADLQFLFTALKAVSENKDIYSLLEDNIDKLNPHFALLLRQWIKNQVSQQPHNAVNIGKLLVRFSMLLQKFDKGKIENNLELAISGYETVLSVLSPENFPDNWAQTNESLINAYRQRQHLLSLTVDKLKRENLETYNQLNDLSSQYIQKLEEAKKDIEDLKENFKISIDNEKVKQINQASVEDIKYFLDEFQKIKQKQNLLENKFHQNKLLKNNFNTAIFYDFENLTMGRISPNLNHFSLTKIKQRIESLEQVDKISVQCAYADWSHPKLKSMRYELQELGIETVQIFDYGYKKNAADIQMTIDVIELAKNRSDLQVFVIVSGDGAFASLTKKLHEYGKTVVGCAYENQTNKILKFVCDEFIGISFYEKLEERFIDENEKGDKQDNQTQKNKPNPDSNRQELENIPDLKTVDIIVAITKVLEALIVHEDFSKQLKNQGIILSQVQVIMKNLIPDFEAKLINKKISNKPGKYLKYILNGANIPLSVIDNYLVLHKNS
jgi:uncharacterized LabA/DUF88 family protein